MKVLQVMYDTILHTVILDDDSDLFKVLVSYDSEFSLEDGKIFYDFGSFKEECQIIDITAKRGVVHTEAH